MGQEKQRQRKGETLTAPSRPGHRPEAHRPLLTKQRRDTLPMRNVSEGVYSHARTQFHHRIR